MITRKQLHNRLQSAIKAGYCYQLRMAIAYVQGIYNRLLHRLWKEKKIRILSKNANCKLQSPAYRTPNTARLFEFKTEIYKWHYLSCLIDTEDCYHHDNSKLSNKRNFYEKSPVRLLSFQAENELYAHEHQ